MVKPLDVTVIEMVAFCPFASWIVAMHVPAPIPVMSGLHVGPEPLETEKLAIAGGAPQLSLSAKMPP